MNAASPMVGVRLVPLDGEAPAAAVTRLHTHAVSGREFLEAESDDAAPLWGTPQSVLWAAGEACMITGLAGVGKSTLAHQVVLARLGILAAVLDQPVTPTERRVLYLACDRPRQIARALRRPVRPGDLDTLAERLVVWRGPLPAQLDREEGLLAELAQAHGADTVVIDSLKDVMTKVSGDEEGTAYNRARQTALRAGVEVLELHHNRKRSQDQSKRETDLAAVYGSQWLVAGAGSILGLDGEAGDLAVTLRHLKPVTEPIGPLELIHDHARGTTRVADQLDPLELLRAAGDEGLTAQGLAQLLKRDGAPSRNDTERARRTLERLAASGLASKVEGTRGGVGGGAQATYRVRSYVPEGV